MARRRIVLPNSGSPNSIGLGIDTESNGVLSDCLGPVTNSYRMGTSGRGADARSQGIIAGSTLIIVVGIRIWFDRFHAVIVDATAAGSASATTKLGYSRF